VPEGTPRAFNDLDRPPLDASGLSRSLVGPGSPWREIRVVQQAASTNADLVAQARQGAPAGLVVVAESQTAGRGRLDRRWVSPPRSGLTVSVLVRPNVDAAGWGWLPLLTGLAVVDAVQSTARVAAYLKWPNDVLVGERKLAGILVERVEAPSPAAVIGLGLNVSMRADELPVPEATSLALAGAETLDRAVMLKSVLRALGTRLRMWEVDRADVVRSGLLDDYRAACRTLGRDVRVALPGGVELEGRAQAIDDDGRLLLITSTGRHLVAAGDVVHLRG
jgi:BirA family transcriptional regulator, biotin operon repressor / biotin---[acetyl-CoA-carboxylase] ligase